MKIRPTLIVRLDGPVDRVRIVRRMPETGGPKGIALYTAVDGRKMARVFRPGDWT